MKDTSTAVSHYLCGCKVPGHGIPREEGEINIPRTLQCKDFGERSSLGSSFANRM